MDEEVKKEQTNTEEEKEVAVADDFVLEEVDEDGEAIGGSLEDCLVKLKRAKKELKDCRKEKEEFLNGWQRCRADYVNSRKAEEKDRGFAALAVKEKIVNDLLPVLDSFKMAFANKVAWEAVDEKWRGGVEGIYGKMIDILRGLGVVEIADVGGVFDVNLHQSVAIEEVGDSAKDDTVTELLQTGYMVDGRVIRPAKVKVGHYAEGGK